MISIEEQSPFPIAKIQLLDRFSVETKSKLRNDTKRNIHFSQDPYLFHLDEEDPLSKELQQLKKSFHDEILSLVDLLDPSLEKVKNIKVIKILRKLNVNNILLASSIFLAETCRNCSVESIGGYLCISCQLFIQGYIKSE